MAESITSSTNNTSNEVPKKPIHTIILDTSPLLLNTPSISTLLAQSHELITTSAVIGEIRGEEARARFETLYRPFIVIRSPKPESVRFVKEFARKTGDAAVLSQTDIEVLALAYELECERNGGDWRLRNVPGQKRVNGRPPERKVVDSSSQQEEGARDEEVKGQDDGRQPDGLEEQVLTLNVDDSKHHAIQDESLNHQSDQKDEVQEIDQSESPSNEVISDTTEPEQTSLQEQEQVEEEDKEDETDSDEGWITPSNIKKRQAQDERASNATKPETKTLQVATMTDDFALQNVLLQINLNLLSTKTCKRISQIKNYILRCHACFQTTKDMTKQFCPRCGKPTLTRVTCTTNDKGEFKLHLKANMQWNNRGNVYSVPKPVPGSANNKWKGPRQGGGHGGWGTNLILVEDQKEYTRAMAVAKRTKEKDLMDEDALPNILSGERDHTGNRIRIGAGRNINSRKRH